MVLSLNQSGIYRISVKTSCGDKFYIGQAKNFRVRFQSHSWKLKNKKHNNPALQAAHDAYGLSAFTFEVLIVCQPEKAALELYEQSILDFYLAEQGEGRIYNVLRECVSARWGLKVSPETRAKMSAALQGRRLSPEHIEILRLSRLGRKLTPEAIAKRTAKQTGRIVRPETREKHAAAMRGIKRSEETRAKISAAKKGFKLSDEHKEKLRAANLGRKKSPEHVEKLAAQKRGKPRDPEIMAKAWVTRRARAAERQSQEVLL